MKVTPENTIILEADLLNAGYITNELLPCPFCGNKSPISIGGLNEETNNIGYKVICTNVLKCGASVCNCFSGDTPVEECRQDIVDKWNRRS